MSKLHLFKSGIRWRVLLLSLLPVFVTSLVLMAYLTFTKMRDLEMSLSDRGATLVRHLAPAAEYGVISGDPAILAPLLASASSDPDIRGVAVFNASGQRLMQAGQTRWEEIPAQTIRVQANRRVEHDGFLLFLAPIRRTELAVDDLGLKPSASLPALQPAIGWVGVEMTRQGLLESRRQAVLQSLLILAAGLALSGLLAWRLGRSVARPILSLARSVERIGEGHLTERVALANDSDEFGILQQGINHMAGSLQAAHEQMQERIDQATARLIYQANHDALTGLINRNEFEHRLVQAISSAQLHDRTHALCYMDLDQFKVINDTCGHSAGDELLRQIALMLKGQLRERDTLARLGGDEFALLLENCELDDARRVAEACRNQLRQFRFKWENHLFSVGVSIGVVMIRQDSGSMAELLSAADAACYVAKDRGRNQLHVYEHSDTDLSRHRGEMQWIARIHKALYENLLRLYWQDIRPVSENSSTPCHVEILLRMVDNAGNVILPMAFIPAAERYALMPRLDRWTVENTIRLCHQEIADAFRATPHRACVFSLNLSGVSLKDHEFRSWLHAQLSQSPGLGQFFCFEITETAAIGDLVTINNFITELKQFGCRFALDDFGSGLSSFNYLKNLQVDFLKIDGAFVHDMADDTLDFSMVEAIHYVSKKVGLKTVAEFVESARVLESLRSIGVEYAQGDYLHRPEPIETLLARFRQDASPPR